MGMPRALGDEHFGVEPSLLDERRRLLGSKTSHIAPPARARNRIDDDNDPGSGVGQELAALLAEVTQHFRSEEPDQRSRPILSQTLQIDSTHATLAELEWPLAAEQMRCELSKTWLVTDQCDPAAFRGSSQLCHHFSWSLTRCQRAEELDGRLARYSGGKQIGRLLRPDKWTRENLIDLHAQPFEAGHTILEADNALVGQWPFVIIRPIVAAFGGNGVAHNIKLAWGRGGRFGHSGS
jgi:hypothetical protein